MCGVSCRIVAGGYVLDGGELEGDIGIWLGRYQVLTLALDVGSSIVNLDIEQWALKRQRLDNCHILLAIYRVDPSLNSDVVHDRVYKCSAHIKPTGMVVCEK